MFETRILRTLAWLSTAFSLCGTVAFGGTPQDDRQVDFSELATTFIADQGLDAESIGLASFSEVLESPGFVFVEIGTFTVCFPSSHLSNKDHLILFREAVTALIDAQGHWIDWYLDERDGVEQARADLDKLRKWVKGWSAGAMKKASLRGGNLLESVKPKEELSSAAARLRKFAGPTEEQLFELGDDVGTILFAPTRQFFLETLGFLGWIDLDRREFYWRDQSVGITAAWYDWIHVVPLEAAKWPVDYKKPFAAASHSERHRTGLRQYVVDRCGASLLRAAFYRTDFSVFESALRTNLVIATAGRDDLYLSDWGLSFGKGGASRPGTSQFIPATGLPGEASAGPGRPRAALRVSSEDISLWRKDAGADNFVKVLGKGQKNGASLAAKRKDRTGWKDKLSHFQLASSESSKKGLASAPFFGIASQRKQPQPEEFKNDYEEFARAYRSAFFFWMREEGLPGSREESHAAFIQLMSAHADPFGEVVFADMVNSVYGVPISAEDGSTDSMEWRFLKWISK